mgnify:CR=1 FL=1
MGARSTLPRHETSGVHRVTTRLWPRRTGLRGDGGNASAMPEDPLRYIHRGAGVVLFGVPFRRLFLSPIRL